VKLVKIIAFLVKLESKKFTLQLLQKSSWLTAEEVWQDATWKRVYQELTPSAFCEHTK